MRLWGISWFGYSNLCTTVELIQKNYVSGSIWGTKWHTTPATVGMQSVLPHM